MSPAMLKSLTNIINPKYGIRKVIQTSRPNITSMTTKPLTNMETAYPLNYSEIPYCPRLISTKSKSDLSRIVVVINAGSRFETQSQLGISHVLRHTIFVSNKYHTIITNTRSFYHIGSEISVEGNRDHIIIKVTCGSRYLFNVLDYIGAALSQPRLYYHEVSYAIQSCLIDYDNLKYHLIQQNVLDELHNKLFRSGYGNSLFVKNNCESAIREFNVADYMQQHVTVNKCAVAVSSDLSHQFVEEYVSECFALPKTVTTDNIESKIHTGETIIPSDCRYFHMALGYPAPSYFDANWASYCVLQKYLSICDEEITCTSSQSRLRVLLHKINPGLKPSSFYIPYDYSGIFGIYMIAYKSDFSQSVRQLCEAFRIVLTENIHVDSLKRAISQAKLEHALRLDNTHELLIESATHALKTSQLISIQSKMEQLNNVTEKDIQILLRKLAQTQPVIVTQANPAFVPSGDEIIEWLKRVPA